MKRIVLCFDGTWSKPADENLPADRQVETNVRRFFESVQERDARGVRQVKWYDQGVGTEWYDRFVGGAFGVGLELNIIEGYRYLATAYEEGDEVYVLGFSRGAYTARSLVGMIRNCGLIRPEHLGFQVGVAYGIYRTRDDGPDSVAARLFRSMFSRPIAIKFLGVWDTVGALGIPLDILREFNMEFYEFHDTKLSAIVENACQAIAIDEHRKDYDVCLWDPESPPGQALEQRWFVGAHCDVGGGYPDRGLSDIALGWMQDRAASLGLALERVEARPDGYLAPFTDSYREFLRGLYARRKPRHYRAIGSTRFGNEVVDESVQRRRRKDRTYEPQNDGLPKL
ncbi:MAG TPA: DUF2235 domain-containing protein [candidate division Zixibacteria bacterium]|nr:DUF2235 domain-containing protein [candidate division Zixibacteria bacterium]